MNNPKFADMSGLTFDDILLLPNYSEIRREEVDLSSQLTGKITLSIPLISAPMDTVTTSRMAIALGKMGGVGVIHRNMTIEEEAAEAKVVKKAGVLTAAAVGVGKDLAERVAALVSEGVEILLVDSAHGYTKAVIEATKYISSKFKETAVIAGNVATAGGAKALIDAGADGLRVGMGPGSICTTRIVSGMGVPQVTAILETVSVARQYHIPVIADGGIRMSGDVVKALACGATTVMAGSLFAGTDEAPGKVITTDGKKYKIYRGMGSVAAMKEGSAARYGQEYRKGQEKKLIAEGVEGMVVYKGSLEAVVTQLIGGLRTGMYYTGVKNIQELQEKTRFIQITQASLVENYPHDILM